MATESLLLELDESSQQNSKRLWLRFPKAVYYVFFLEFCERFTYYGLRCVLVLYLINQISIPTNRSAAILHIFVFFSHVTTLLGAYIADSVLGRYYTIVVLVAIFTLGMFLLTMSAISSYKQTFLAFGLIFISFGAGGIKPCITTLGADQLDYTDAATHKLYFSVVYFCIRCGSLLSLVLPLIHNSFQCFQTECYAAAFGVPTTLLLFSLILFLTGQHCFIKPPIHKNIFTETVSCIIHATRLYLRKHKNKRKPLLDYALGKYNKQFIHDVRGLGRIVILFLPLPVFFALYSQQYSRWILQATQMDGFLFSDWVIPPDQMVTLNPLLVLLFIPLFQIVIFPLLEKFSAHLTYLRQMVAGLIFIGLAFFVAFLLQIRIEELNPASIRDNGTVEISLLSLIDCPVSVATMNNSIVLQSDNIYSNFTNNYKIHFIQKSKTHNLQLNVSMKSCTNSHIQMRQLNESIISGESYILVVWSENNPSSLLEFHTALLPSEHIIKKLGKSQIRVLTIDNTLFSGIASLRLYSKTTIYPDLNIPIKNSNSNLSSSLLVTDYLTDANRARYQALLILKDDNESQSAVKLQEIDIKNNEISTMILQRDNHRETDAWIMHHLIELEGSQLSILWQLPQYILLSMAEVLFIVSGYSFAYTEAPSSMKTTVMALFFLNVAFGNLVMFVIYEGNWIGKRSLENLLFVLICAFTTVCFSILAYRYIPRPADDTFYTELKQHSEDSTEEVE